MVSTFDIRFPKSKLDVAFVVLRTVKDVRKIFRFLFILIVIVLPNSFMAKTFWPQVTFIVNVTATILDKSKFFYNSTQLVK